MKDYIEIQGRKIGEGYPTFIIAEISANHLQCFDNTSVDFLEGIDVPAHKIAPF